jgi:hypothetical protein
MLRKLKRYWKVGAGGILSTVLLILDHLYNWGVLNVLWGLLTTFARIVTVSPVPSALVVLFLLIVALWLRYRKLAKYVAISFKDNFRKNLSKNWDFQGGWQLVHDNELLVTQSDMGGITKVGQLWTDYRFEFDAIIVNDRIGWVVRSQDLFNYYMIQLTPTLIRPHLRFGGQWVLIGDRPHNQQIVLNKWLHVQTDVRGSEIRIYVDLQEVYYNNNFFSMKFIQFVPQQGGNPTPQVAPAQPNTLVVPAFTTGRVGFRMWGTEEGRISRVRVKPL